jgi:hypothetical protein
MPDAAGSGLSCVPGLAEDEEGENTMITREQAKRLAEVAQAIADGKRVTFHGASGLELLASDSEWLHPNMVFTIHEPPPEPKYRPWTLEEAVDNLGRVVMPCHGTEAYLLVGTLEGSTSPLVLLGGFEESMDVSELLDGWQFLDGTPCGVRE